MEHLIIQIVANAMITAAKLSGLVVGLILSIIQSATQIQEATLTFLPKVVAAAVVLVITGSWALQVLEGFTRQVFAQVPTLLGS